MALAMSVPALACVVERMRSPTDMFGVDTCSVPSSFQDPDVDLQVGPDALVLPAAARTRLNEYLSDRVGPRVAQTLRIREVWYLRNVASGTARTPRLDDEPPGVAYAVFVGLPVVDDMSDCGNSVDHEYCAGVWLSDRGEPLSDIGLPHIARDPAKAHLLSRAEAEATVAGTGLDIHSATLNYEPSLDILVWRLEGSHMQAGGERNAYISYSVNAHTGTILGWRDLTVLYAR